MIGTRVTESLMSLTMSESLEGQQPFPSIVLKSNMLAERLRPSVLRCARLLTYFSLGLASLLHPVIRASDGW